MLLKPYFTEKSLSQADLGRYTFIVPLSATKHQVKAIIESLYQVNVTKVQTSTKTTAAKSSYARTRRFSSPNITKKATVYLKSGQKIDLFKTK